MQWIEYVAYFLAFFAVFWIGFGCGYVKDKKEVQEMYGETVKIRDEAADSLFRSSQKLNDAKEFLDSTDHIRDEARAFLEEAKKKLAEAERIRNGGEDECSGGV